MLCVIIGLTGSGTATPTLGKPVSSTLNHLTYSESEIPKRHNSVGGKGGKHLLP